MISHRESFWIDIRFKMLEFGRGGGGGGGGGCLMNASPGQCDRMKRVKLVEKDSIAGEKEVRIKIEILLFL